MTKTLSTLQDGVQYLEKRGSGIWDNLLKNNLWKRILKNVLATTILISIALIPASRNVIGGAAYLGAMTTVFGHPGRRFGQMAEALILAVSGTVLGVAWSTLGLYLSSLVNKGNAPAAYAIRAVFLGVTVILHGYLRSKAPRLFIFVLLLIICAVVNLTSTAQVVTATGITQILFPVLIAVGIIILINIVLFPEFSSSYLGQMTIETLGDTVKALEKAGTYFIAPDRPDKDDAIADTEKSAAFLNDHHGSAGQSTTLTHLGSRSGRSGLVSVVKQKLYTVTQLKQADHDDPSIPVPKRNSVTTMADLTAAKAKLRNKLNDCKEAQQECNFELAVAVLPPRDLKPISGSAMKRLVANTIAVIGACESKFALVGEKGKTIVDSKLTEDENDSRNTKDSAPQRNEESKKPVTAGLLSLINRGERQKHEPEVADHERAELIAIKPKREIEFGDVCLLRYLTASISEPYTELYKVLNRTVEVVIACVAYVYDVPKLPSGAKPPSGITLEELDVHMDTIQVALIRFDADCAAALEGASVLEDLQDREPDIMPREEVFLISSFMLNVRQAGTHIEDMLVHARELVQSRHHRYDRRRIYAPRIKWSKWLYTGGQEDEALPATGRKINRKGAYEDHLDDDADLESINNKKTLLSAQNSGDPEMHAAETKIVRQVKDKNSNIPTSNNMINGRKESISTVLRLRGKAADILEWIQDSEDLVYAFKLTVAVFLVLWPAFIASWTTWYSLNRGLWAALQLILITEVSIGTSVKTFVVRGVGTTLGCLWGWAALEARNGDRVVCAIMICIGCFPFAYIQLGSKHPKAGAVSIVSICVVALATEIETVPGTPTENFLKRWIAFTIGGFVALLVEMVLLPVKARTRLVESISSALKQINDMEKCVAYGIEEGVKIDIFAKDNSQRFENASSKANGALIAAETFLPFCSNEPRLKGSFEGLALIYREMLFVLHQIVDRMDNMLQLRTAYGSGPLEEFNADIYPYRRNVAGSITLTLFAIHGALTTKLPLPQFLPSARLAHLRMINRVREVVMESVSKRQDDQEITAKLARQQAVRRKYLSWNASSAAQAEIIEFLEELIDLTKLLVGASEFRSGLLLRPTYQDYATKKVEEEDEARDEIKDNQFKRTDYVRRRRGTTSSSGTSGDEIPASLRRIQSRKFEASMKRQTTNEKSS